MASHASSGSASVAAAAHSAAARVPRRAMIGQVAMRLAASALSSSA